MRMLSTALLTLLALSLAACGKQLVPYESKMEQVATGFVFTEGPAADEQGRIHFTDIPNNKIHVYDPATGKTELFRENSGAANGLLFDRDGSLIVCEGGNRQLTRVSSCGCCVETLAATFAGRKFNSPNDLTLDRRGGVYFTDPRYGPRDNMQWDVEAVYYRDKFGNVTQVARDLQRPNGIALSPSGRTLYVADHAAKQIIAYDVGGPGKLSNKRVFATMDAPGGADGMTVDRAGNLYAAGPGQVFIWNKRGVLMYRLKVPEIPANVAFGGKNSPDLYITASKSLYRIRLNAKGVR